MYRVATLTVLFQRVVGRASPVGRRLSDDGKPVEVVAVVLQETAIVDVRFAHAEVARPRKTAHLVRVREHFAEELV